VNVAWPENSDKKASSTNQKEIAQDIGSVYTVVRLIALADCHPSLHWRNPVCAGYRSNSVLIGFTNVRLAEIHSFEQERFAGRLR